MGFQSQEFESAFHFAAIGMAILSPEGKWLRVNRAAQEMFGYSEEEFRSTNFQSVTHPDDLGADLELVQELLQGKRETYQMEKRYFHRSGRILWASLSVSLVRHDDGTPRYFISQIQDITALKDSQRTTAEAVEKAEAASRTKSEFLVNVSHEIRTPLCGIMGMAELLLTTKLETEQRNFASNIIDCGQGLLGVINDLLDLSKIEAGRIELETVDFDLNDMLENLLVSFRVMAEQKGLSLQYRHPDNWRGRYRGDPLRIRQVLTNLLGNALKFTHEGEVSLEVTTAPATDERSNIRICVRDTGPGIPIHVLPRLFRPFSQGDPSITRRFGGTGLGLAIAKRLLDQMGGHIEVDSRPGQGTAFTASLTLANVASYRAPAEPAVPMPLLRVQARTERILIVEDNVVNQVLLQKFVARMGFGCDVVGDGFGALEALESSQYQLILMDCQMPGLDGVEATRRIRASGRPYRDIPVVAVTAHGVEEEKVRCLAAGMNGYLMKPLRLVELEEVLGRWLVPEASALT